MENLYLDRLKELDRMDRNSMESAMEDLASMVRRDGRGKKEKSLMTRRFPERSLKMRDILLFSLWGNIIAKCSASRRRSCRF